MNERVTMTMTSTKSSRSTVDIVCTVSGLNVHDKFQMDSFYEEFANMDVHMINVRGVITITALVPTNSLKRCLKVLPRRIHSVFSGARVTDVSVGPRTA